MSVNDVFDFLKINNTLSPHNDSLTGFLLNQQDIYLVDKTHHIIRYKGKLSDLPPQDLIATTTGLYLKSDHFGQVFGLNGSFNFRSLSFKMETKLDLPVIREMKQELMRNNINRLRGIVKADTVIGRDYPAFKMGMADWSVISTQQQQGLNYTGLNVILGGVLAGGETDISVNYNNNQQFIARNQLYLWHFVNNDNPLLKQVTAGKITPPAIASIYAPLIGIALTNTPSLTRSALGTYRLSDVTEPGWTVELYVNNELIDYKQADPSGFFTFKVPTVYGNTLVELRFYGPYGEERFRRRNINIPYNFLPKNEFEYTAYAGVVEDSTAGHYARGSMNYGISDQITVGGGTEYLSSIPSRKIIPFTNVSWRPAPNLMLYAEYAYGVKTKAILNYRLPSDLEIELDYILYDKNEKAVLFNYPEERKAIITLPIRGKNFIVFSRLTIDQIKLPTLQYTNVELMLSGVIAGMNTNLTTFSHFSGMNRPIAYSILSQSYRLPEKLLLTPQVQYEYEAKDFTMAKFDLERPIFNHGYLKLSFERDFLFRSYNTGIGLRYDFSFARTAITANTTSHYKPTLTQTASGSLLYDKATKYLAARNNSNAGKAGFTVLAYLDLNGNGRRDADEPKVEGLSLRINGGIVEYSMKDTLIRILNLEPNRKYLIAVNADNFDNIAWQLRKATLGVTAEPNQLKLIEIPITVSGEVSGTVYIKNNDEQQGMGKIKIAFYDKRLKVVAQVLTESDGYFSYLGLPPGSYTVRVDTTQLRNLQLTATPPALQVTIRRLTEGDMVDGLEFILKKRSDLFP